MKLSWRNPFFILGLVLFWRVALLVFTAQPIPANDAFIFDGGVANWLKHGHYVNPCLEVGFPISSGQVFSIYPPVYQLALLVWMPVFGTSALSMMAMHLVMFAVGALLAVHFKEVFSRRNELCAGRLLLVFRHYVQRSPGRSGACFRAGLALAGGAANFQPRHDVGWRAELSWRCC